MTVAMGSISRLDTTLSTSFVTSLAISYVQRKLALVTRITPSLVDVLPIIVKKVPHFPSSRIIYFHTSSEYCRIEQRAIFFNGGTSRRANLEIADKYVELLLPIFPDLDLAASSIINIMGRGFITQFPSTEKLYRLFMHSTRCNFVDETDVNICLPKYLTGLPATLLFAKTRSGKFTFNGLKDDHDMAFLTDCINNLFTVFYNSPQVKSLLQ